MFSCPAELIAGLKVAYVSGKETDGQQDEKGKLLTYSKESVRVLRLHFTPESRSISYQVVTPKNGTQHGGSARTFVQHAPTRALQDAETVRFGVKDVASITGVEDGGCGASDAGGRRRRNGERRRDSVDADACVKGIREGKRGLIGVDEGGTIVNSFNQL
ncbi:hypothetical protein PsorP6_009375 [Peronosclerospora sorghi]|uniref:Uncharacterized protein n=1 Tax=Peronosclerospora sorghi TaxID=230839 RepID=A0ACC0VY03_9STRA|nr:hypothetical protein PsorP6_009375 [Peronosclerospora sorghi]